MDFESGFWQVLLHEKSRDKTAFFVPNGQKRWTVMPMGCLNAHGTFCCLVDTLKRQWNKKATELGIRDDIEVTLKGERPWTDAEVIVDDIMLHSEHTAPLIKYFEIVLQILQRHQVTVKLKKCRFFPKSAEFVGMDVEADGNRPARSKMQALEDLKNQAPNTVTDLRQLIGLIGFYQDWIANYELRIGRWRQHIKKLKGTKPTESEITLASEWQQEDNQLLNELLDELITRPTLARPDYTRRFYLKTDWCRLGMAAVLLQADPNDHNAALHETQETSELKPCKFDKHMHNLRLRPIAFSSRKCTESESAMHSYTGEAATGVWAIEKYKRHLFGKEFTWMTDCNGLRQFFDGEDVPTHMHQRMRQRLLRFHFTIVHRPARFMVECDVLTRYNTITSKWRPETPPISKTNQNQIAIAIATTNQPPEATEDGNQPKTLLAAKSDNTRNIWTYNAGATNIETAAAEAGITTHIRSIEERPTWRTHPFDRHRTDPKLLTIEQLETIIEPTERVDWIIAHDGCETDASAEIERQFARLTHLINIGERHNVKAIAIFTHPTTRIHDDDSNEETSAIDMRMQQLEGNKWNTLRATVQSNRYGAAIATTFTMIIATKDINTLRAFHLQGSDATPLSDIVNNAAEQHEPNVSSSEIRAMQRPPQARNVNEPQIAALIQRTGQEDNTRDWITAWTPCYSTDHPGPDLHDTSTQWYESPFAIETTSHDHTSTVRGIRHHELVDIIGYDEDTRYRMLQLPPEMAVAQMRATPLKQLMTTVIIGIQSAENKTGASENTTEIPATSDDDGIDDDLRRALTVMLAHEFQQTTAIPLPTTAQWQDATANDWDLNRLVHAIREGRQLQREEIENATLYKLWSQQKLEEENGILFHTGKGENRRHLRTRIPPPKLRQAIFSALHVAPMAGHTGYQKTFWKIAARYYWPNMATDIKQLTLGCGHCNAANITSHEAQQQLATFQADEPFDVITLDVWHPGRAATVKKGNGTHVVTCIDTMTGFAAATFVNALDSETMTRAAFTSFFINHGLPRLVIIDSGSEFAGAMQTLCQNIGLPNYTVSKGNHKAIICERFHRYLNKVQRIHAADCETFQDFMFGTIFAVYAWNSAPVDGTNIVRSYAAIGREFPFPIDFEHEPIVPRDHEAQGQQTIEHVDSAFPLWRQQQEVLKVLINDRRDHHRNLKNEGRNMKSFAPGDLVVIKKQVQTTQENGPAKARMHARGPYRILEQIKPGTYRVQKLPGIRGAGRRGRITKESAARLTRIPSTLVIHKPTTGIDTRLATYRHAIVDNPLENILGLHEPGRYRQAEPEQPFAYDKIEDMWQEDIDNMPHENSESNSDSDDDDDSSGDDGDDNNDSPPTTSTPQMTHQTPPPPPENNDDPDGDRQRQDGIAESTTPNAAEDIPDTGNGDALGTKRKANITTTNNKRKKTAPDRPQRTSTRTTNKPARFRDEATRATDTDQQQRMKAHKLYKATRKSRDKLFFIRHTIDTTSIQRWYVVQVKLQDDDTETTRDEGKYKVWFYIREHANSKERQLRNCRYWPEIHKIRPNGTLGEIVPIRPGKVTAILDDQPGKYRVYEQTINLCEFALVGPFDFAHPRHYQNEGNRIAFEEWEELKSAAKHHDLDRPTLEPVDRSRGNKCGRAESAGVVVTFRCRIDVHRRRTESNWNLGSDTAAGNDPITSLAPMYPNAQPTNEQKVGPQRNSAGSADADPGGETFVGGITGSDMGDRGTASGEFSLPARPRERKRQRT
ncbi:hypothetical protein MHU86_6077 [Fragilaria crotonensis]|nr:hypothetical protein MHU86_6077 [Fragilaria crotonensis]